MFTLSGNPMVVSNTTDNEVEMAIVDYNEEDIISILNGEMTVEEYTKKNKIDNHVLIIKE